MWSICRPAAKWEKINKNNPKFPCSLPSLGKRYEINTWSFKKSFKAASGVSFETSNKSWHYLLIHAINWNSNLNKKHTQMKTKLPKIINRISLVRNQDFEEVLFKMIDLYRVYKICRHSRQRGVPHPWMKYTVVLLFIVCATDLMTCLRSRDPRNLKSGVFADNKMTFKYARVILFF